MASEIRVDKINSLSGVGTVTLSPTGVDIAGITTVATFKVGTGLTASSDGNIFATGVTTSTTFVGAVTGNVTGNVSGNVTGNVTGNQSGGTVSATSAAVADLTSGRVVLAGTSGELQDDSNLSFGSNQLTVHEAKLKGNQLRFEPSGTTYIDHYTTGQDIQFRTSVSSSLDTTGPTIKSTGNIAFASGKGIDFSATGDGSGASGVSELLDDYEEGLFTPTVSAQYGTPSVTYQGSDNRRGRYVKIGKMVHVNVLVGWQQILGGVSGNLRIGGLPFAHENVEHADPNDYTQSVGSCYFQNLTVPHGNNGHTVVYIWGGYSTYVVLMQTQNDGGLAVVAANAGNNNSNSAGTIKYVQFSLTYPAS